MSYNSFLRHYYSLRECWRIMRSCGYGRTEAFLTILSNRVFGTKLYWYPWRQRAAIRRERNV